MSRPVSPAHDDQTVDPSAATQLSDPPPRGPTPAASGPRPTASPGQAQGGADPLLGRTLHHFRVDAPLGRGGMGAVYRAWDLSLERPVALKVLLHDSPAARARFLREARAQAKLRHPNVVPIHFVGDAEGLAFFVMEVVEGESLSAIIDRGPMPPDRALEVVDVVAQALEAGHAQGLVHRDVKPSNILIDRIGRVLLADFGLAKDVRSSEKDAAEVPDGGAPTAPAAPRPSDAITRVGSIVGTPAYVSPEQAAGQPVDFRSDIYALGVTLYEAVTGQPPFSAPSASGLLEQHKKQEALSPRLLVPSLTPALDALITRMMQKNPAARYASYVELRQAIAAARTRQTFKAPPVPRIIAFIIDFCLFGLTAAFAAWVARPLAFPGLALVFGVVEGQWGRTPGKKWMRLCAVGPFDAPIGFPRAIARNELKMWGPTVASLLELVPVLNGVSSVAWLVMAAWSIDMIVGAFGQDRRALHDRIAGARVVVALEEASAPPRLGGRPAPQLGR